MDPGAGDQIQRMQPFRIRLHRQRTAMPDGDRGVKAGLQHGFGDDAQAGGIGVAGLIDVEIGIEAPFSGMGKEGPQPFAQPRIGKCHAAQHAPAFGDQIGQIGEFAAPLGVDAVDQGQAGGLQFDPVGGIRRSTTVDTLGGSR